LRRISPASLIDLIDLTVSFVEADHFDDHGNRWPGGSDKKNAQNGHFFRPLSRGFNQILAP
jgi:hypothetical protein